MEGQRLIAWKFDRERPISPTGSDFYCIHIAYRICEKDKPASSLSNKVVAFHPLHCQSYRSTKEVDFITLAVFGTFSENPSIREMFKLFDLIESFGSGVGKAKRAMAENGSDGIRYQEYDENIDITSVMIPISRKYLRYSYKAMDLAAKDQNLDFGREKTKINSVDAIGIINRSTYSNSIRKTLTAIFDCFFNKEFGRADIVSYLSASKSAGTNYISYLQKLNVVEQVKGKGKGKYRFR